MDAIVYDKVGKEAEKIRGALYGIYPQETITDAAIASFDDGADDIPVKALTVGIEPVQDLHGYENPWPAGGGKNLLPLTLDYIKSLNTGTWNNNKYTTKGVEFTVNTDNAGNVISINANASSAATDSATLRLASNITIAEGNYIGSGCPASGGGSSYYILYSPSSGNDYYNSGTTGASFSVDSSNRFALCQIVIASGYQPSNIVFYPMIRLASEADATFAPYENICPITGWTGAKVTRTEKNLFKTPYSNSSITRVGITATVNDDGSVKFTGTPTADFYFNFRSTSDKLILPVGTYTISINQMPSACALYVPGNFLNAQNLQRTIAISDNSGIYTYIMIPQSAGYINFTLQIQIEYGDIKTEYEPYQGETYDIAFPTEAGTVYGGSLTVNRDETGELVVDRTMVDLGTLVWERHNAGKPNKFEFFATKNGMKYVPNNEIPNASCSHYEVIARSAGYGGTYGININAQYNQICITDDTYTDTEVFKAALSGAQFVYELATPVTYTLTPTEIRTLLGKNNVWADTGNIKKLTYHADLGKYIDSHITTAVANALNA